VINIRAIVCNNPSIAEELRSNYHKYLLVFDREHSARSAENTGCNHTIELIDAKDTLRMGPIYQLSQDDEKILIQYLQKMIKDGKIWPSSSSVRSPILFVPKPNRKGVWLCEDYSHLNDPMKKDKTLQPIMEELQSRVKGATDITKIDIKAEFHLIGMALGHENFTAFRSKFGLHDYMVMPFRLTNTTAALQREINRILRPLLGIELVINTKEDIDKDSGMVVLGDIDHNLIAMKESMDKNRTQVLKVFQPLMDNHKCVEIDKCMFDATEVPF